MEKLLVTKYFADYFKKRAEGTSNNEAYWYFKKELQGNHENYGKAIEVLKEFMSCFEWLEPTLIQLPNSEDIDSDKLPFYRKEDNISLDEWINKVLRLYSSTPFINICDDYSGIEFNYNIEVVDSSDGKEAKLFKSDYSVALLFLTYNNKLDITYYHWDFEIRGEPFYETPWGSSFSDFKLPSTLVSKNRQILSDSLKKIQEKGYSLERNGSKNPQWQVDKDGFK